MRTRSERGCFFDDLVGFDDVSDLDVVVRLDRETALVAGEDLAGVVLEALQAAQLAGVDLDAVADDPDLGGAGDLALDDEAAGHGADLGDLEGLADLDLADRLLAADGGEEADH